MTSTIFGSDLRRITTAGFPDEHSHANVYVTAWGMETASFVCPNDEWLFCNPSALTSVQLGLLQAGAGMFVHGPDLNADKAFADSLLD